jgi:hypothetical protein
VAEPERIATVKRVKPASSRHRPRLLPTRDPAYLRGHPGGRFIRAEWWRRSENAMLGHIVRLLAPRAVEMLLDKVSASQAPTARPSEGPRSELDGRVEALHRHVEATAETHRKQVGELAQALRVIGLRSAIALWLSIASALISLVGMAWLIFRS